MMKWGIGTYTFTWAIGVAGYDAPQNPLDALGLLERAVTLGAAVVQYCDNLPLTALNVEERSVLLRRAQETGIALEIGTRGIAADNLRENLALARQCESPFVRVVVDKGSDEPTPEQVITRLRPLLPEFENAGVKLALENHDRFTARTLANIIEELNPARVGICLDTVNSFGSLEGPEIVVETLRPYVVNLHVKDFTVRRVPHQMGFLIEGAPAGQGRLNVPYLMTQLPPDISAILELWTPYQNATEATIQSEDKWAAESVSYLKPLLGE